MQISAYRSLNLFDERSGRVRGTDQQPRHMFSYVSLEQRVPADHPLRPIRQITDRILAMLSPKFTKMYSKIGRPSIPPEKLLRALLLQILYTVRSERLLMEQLEYNLLFRWFVGLKAPARLRLTGVRSDRSEQLSWLPNYITLI